MSTSNISRLHTSCKECIFAKWDNNCQTSCEMDKLSTNETVEVYDGENEFFVVNNAKCHYKRNHSWGEKTKKENWKNLIKTENRIKYQVIIFAYNDMDEIRTMTTSLLKQEIPPQHITIVRRPNNTIRPSIISDHLKSLGVIWRLENTLDSNLNNFQIIDSILSTRSYPYYAIFTPDVKIPHDLFNVINKHIYDKCLQFAILINDERPVVVSTSIHHVYGGNFPTSLMQKLRDDKCDTMIKPIQEICPKYPPLYNKTNLKNTNGLKS